MNWTTQQTVEHFDLLGEGPLGPCLLGHVRVGRLPAHLVGGSGRHVHCVTNQLHLGWKPFTGSHILIYFHCTASDSG